MFGCFLRNDVTLLYVTSPVDETVSEYDKINAKV